MSAVAEERRYGESHLFKKKNNSSIHQFLIFHRDVMASSLSAVNAIVLLELKTVNTQLVRDDPSPESGGLY